MQFFEFTLNKIENNDNANIENEESNLNPAVHEITYFVTQHKYLLALRSFPSITPFYPKYTKQLIAKDNKTPESKDHYPKMTYDIKLKSISFSSSKIWLESSTITKKSSNAFLQPYFKVVSATFC